MPTERVSKKRRDGEAPGQEPLWEAPSGDNAPAAEAAPKASGNGAGRGGKGGVARTGQRRATPSGARARDPHPGERKGPGGRPRQAINTQEHVDRIADRMAAGEWGPKASHDYAREFNAQPATVRGWASIASRVVHAWTSEERGALAISTMAKLDAIAEEARRDGDYKASSAALNLLSDIAGLKAPKRLEVNATIAEAPGELSVLMQRASDPQLPEAERDEAAEQFKAALLIKLLDDIDAMPNRERRAELVAMVRAKAAAYGEAPLLLTEGGAA